MSVKSNITSKKVNESGIKVICLTFRTLMIMSKVRIDTNRDELVKRMKGHG